MTCSYLGCNQGENSKSTTDLWCVTETSLGDSATQRSWTGCLVLDIGGYICTYQERSQMEWSNLALWEKTGLWSQGNLDSNLGSSSLLLWPWAHELSYLSLSFLTCAMGLIMPPLQGVMRIQWDTCRATAQRRPLENYLRIFGDEKCKSNWTTK